jgi:hypothetical protein
MLRLSIIAVLLATTAVLVSAQVGHHMRGHSGGQYDADLATGGGNKQSGGSRSAQADGGATGTGTGAEAPVAQQHVPHQHSLTLIMQRGDPERCFYLSSKQEDDRLLFSYKVVGGAGRPLFDLTIRSPQGTTIFQNLGGTGGEYTEEGREGNKIFFLSKTPGEYAMCVSSPQQEIVVALNAAASSKKRAINLKKDGMIRQVAAMKGSIEALLEDLAALRSRERSHRDTLEDALRNLTVQFVIEMIAILAGSGGFVYFLQRLFEKKSTRNA